MSRTRTSRRRPPRKPMRIIPLGGLKEIGKNMTVYEYNEEIILVDAGSEFPDDELLGVDVVIPDTAYLEENAHKIKAIIYTHGHEDHIGATPYILRKFQVPLYGTPFTLGLIERRLKEHNIKAKMITKKAGDVFTVGAFTIEFIHVNHSIPDAVAVLIRTEQGSVLQTGDFKVDFSPVNTPIIDLARLGAIGNEGLDLLLSDSTNVMHSGYTLSEGSVGATFNELFRGSDSRIIIASFASNVSRIQLAANAARLHQRKVAFTGRSMNNVVRIAMDLGYLKIPPEDIIDINEVNQYPDNEIVIMTTGSQGEPMSALTRMADNTHAQVQMKSGDMVILSSSPIPGNEKSVISVINKLFELGVEVIYHELADVHASGHAKREELRLMLALLKPRNFLPVHGEYAMLRHHADLALQMGVSPKNVFLIENGVPLEMMEGKVEVGKPVPSGRILIDGSLIGDVGTAVLRDRKQLSEDGLLMLILRMDKDNRQLLKEPDIISRGFVYMKESTELIDEAKNLMTKTVTDMKPATKSDWSQIKQQTRNQLSRFFYEKTKRRPMILVFILEV
ncbi:MAG: ribonuclease J [Tissierellia bacterium]|nr:ribonuclease J [Bacillota bacterium]NLL23518.1 ribonuclease J [Tissierellia bacterium]